MKPIRKIITSFLYLTCISFLLASCNKGPDTSSAVALVDNKTINKDTYNSELEFYLNYYSNKYGPNYLESKDKAGKTKKESLQEKLLESMIKDQVMLNDLEKHKIEIDDNTANKIRSEMEKKLGDKDSLKANIKALNVSDSEFSDIIFNDSIRRMHYDFFLSNSGIKDSEILKHYKENEQLHKMYKYNMLKFDDKIEAERIKSIIKSQLDFRKLLTNSIKSYDVFNSDFVYEDDPILLASKVKEKDKVSEIFEYDGKYNILMVNSYNENENELLMQAKEIYLKDAYRKYLNKLIKSSKIKLFI
ncbi:SurA N-terminal domain-containing protein [uncultured Anaerococcus sp.]|uniref:SurA N-terminal domain-containing protein n=1 Tax=uncultured Anaerococcus sp. TaxID=293428 RepID=UPI00288B61A2|nr:SurA N-terminal domain-containing protein [uncultured Anaerococcus sp.]